MNIKDEKNFEETLISTLKEKVSNLWLVTYLELIDSSSNRQFQ